MRTARAARRAQIGARDRDVIAVMRLGSEADVVPMRLSARPIGSEAADVLAARRDSILQAQFLERLRL